MSLVPFIGVCAGGVLVFLGGASISMTGVVGFREWYAIVGGATIVLASMYIHARMVDKK